ncbi:MAG: acetylornithine deacetylase [Sneathiellaceae bacterium]
MTASLREATAILSTLVAFDTVSHKSNRALIDWVSDYLDGLGVAVSTLPSPDGQKANVFATIGGKGGGGGGILLSGHTDVVPVDGQDWRHDPFRLTAEEGRLYGRGACDMKGYIACVLAAVPDMLEAPLSRPIHLAFSYDEEVGCFGAIGLIDHMAAAGIRPAMAFVGEPTSMRVVNAHKGSCGMKTKVTGLACHSSRVDLGSNAIYAAMDVIDLLRRRADALAAAPDSLGLFEPPYSTINVGIVHGGSARNTVAGDCTLLWDIRATREGMVAEVRGEVEAAVAERILPAMRDRHAAAEIDIETLFEIPPLLPQPNNAAEALARELAGTGEACSAAFGSEGGLFQRAGMPCILCGPGDIAQAHAPDEWVAESQLAACQGFLDRLVAREAGA